MKHSPFLPSTVLSLLAAAAFAARPVARWDVIPDQRVSGIFRAGVCAFHEDGVSVEFTIDGEIAYVAEKPTLNPRTGVWEYVFPVNTALLPDGPVVLGARAFTLAATPESFTLPTLPLFANNGGSLDQPAVTWVDAVNGDDASGDGSESAPFKTLAKGVKSTPVGGTVYLKPGEYSPGGLGGGTRPYWTTVSAAPGVARADVQIGPGRPGTDRIRFRGVEFYCDATNGYATILTGENGSNRVWLDDCSSYNRRGRWAANANTFGNRYVAYVTGGLTYDLNNGPDGDIIRGHCVSNIASDVWTGSDRLVVNSTCFDVDGGDTGAHPDFHQSHAEAPSWVHDVILYNVSGYNCKCQGLFGVRLRDSAFVNVVFERTTESYFLTQYSDVMENVLFAHVTLLNQSWSWRESYAPTDVRVYNCLAQKMSSSAAVGLDGSGRNGLLVSNCFFYQDKGAFGLGALAGDPLFTDAANSVYTLRSDSPALANFRPFQCIPADIDGNLYAPAPAGLRTLGGTSAARFPLPADRTWPANDGDAEVCLWKGDAFAAGSITIDDNCAFDHDWWLDQAAANDLRLTWFVITDNVEGSNPGMGGTWAGWQRLADAGHAVQSHSTNHKGSTEDDPWTEEQFRAYYRDSRDAVNAHVTNNVCECLAYPGGNGETAVTNLCADYYIAARGTVGTPNQANKINYLQTNASSSSDVAPYLTSILGGTVESPAWLNNANYRRGWHTTIIHAVQANTNAVADLIREYVSRRPDLWVDTYPAVAKYGMERDTASLSTYAVDANHLVLTLTDGMDDAVYAEPLTLKVRLPAAWTNLTATQSGRLVPASVVATNGVSYGLVDAVPDAGAVTLYNLAAPDDGEEEEAGGDGDDDPPVVPDPPPATASYTITFADGLGGTVSTLTVEEGATPPAPAAPVRDGYEFAGWSPALGAATADTVYTALWTKIPDVIAYTTNTWIGANTSTSAATAAMTDLDDPANWSLNRVPGVGNTDFAYFPQPQQQALLYCGTTNRFAPSAISLNYNHSNGGRWIYIDKSLTLDSFAIAVYGASAGGGSGQFNTKLHLGANATSPAVLTLTGSGEALDLTAANANWGNVGVGTTGMGVFDFTAPVVTFSKGKGVRTFDNNMGGGSYTETATTNANATVRFSAPGGSVHLADQGRRGTSLGLGYSNLELRSDQTWTADETAYIRELLRVGPSGIPGPPVARAIDGGRLDNLGALNFVLARNHNGCSAANAPRIPGGTYGSFRLAGGNTSRRDSYVVLDGDVTVIGRTVLPVSAVPRTAAESAVVSSSNTLSTAYGLQMIAAASQMNNWYLELGGHALVLSNGLQMVDAEGSSASGGPGMRVDALDSTLTVLGDLEIWADNKAATNGVSTYATQLLGIRGNAGTVLNLGGDFRSNCRSLYLAANSANNAYNQNLSTATVNLVGGADAEHAFEVADAATLAAPARNTSSIGTLHVGTDTAEANVRLVNDCLNDNPVAGYTVGTDPNDLRVGERLVAGSLSVGPGSRLAVNGQQVRVAGSFTMAPDATLDLSAGTSPAQGQVFDNFRAAGDQTAAWAVFAPQVTDSAAPRAQFSPRYIAADDCTVWYVSCLNPATLILVQ